MNNDKSSLTAFCHTCNKDVDVERITEELGENPAAIQKYLSCGHSIIQDECVDIVSLSDELIVEHFNAGKKLLSKDRSTKSGETKRPLQKIIIIDRKRGVRIHRVEEQDENGEWWVVHYQEDPI